VNGRSIVALIDTGSDLCLMRANQHSDIGSFPLEQKKHDFEAWD